MEVNASEAQKLIADHDDLQAAIVNEANDRGIPLYLGMNREENARKLAEEAYKAFQQGAKSETVMVIINMIGNYSQGSTQGSAKPPKEDRHSFMEEVIATTNRKPITERENLPEPPEIEGQPPELPGDITQKSEAEVRRLHSEFFASFARAGYLLSIKENESENAKSIMDYYEDRKVSDLEVEGIKGSVTSLKAKAAKQEPKIGEWRAKWLSARAEARELRGLKEIYDKACDRLSREMSMRETEKGEG